MGCFLGCFGGAKSKERRHRRRKHRSPAHSSSSPSAHARARCSPRKADRDAAAAPLLSTLLELRDSTDDMCLTVVKKKVTFDSNVTAYEAPAIPEGEEAAGGKGEEEEAAAWKGEEEEEAAVWMLGPGCAKSEAFPLNHRYGGGGAGDDDRDYDDDEEYYSDDEDEYEDGEEEEYEDGIDAINDDEEDHGCGLLGIARGEEEACESLFLLPVVRAKDSAGQQEPTAGVAAPTRERAGTSVLSSVENFAEWKDATKPRTAAPKNSDKENVVTLGQENRSTDALSDPNPAKKKERPPVSADYTPSTPSKQEASVDASLSTWLGSTGTPESRSNSVRSYSPISREDRPILGALTVEDIKISSANSSPMRSRSPSPSPDDMPILGTVGAYWNCSANGGDDSVTRGGFMKTRSRFGQEQKW